MDQAWIEELVAALGERFRLGAPAEPGVSLSFRFGKAEFRPSQMSLGTETGGRGVRFRVDVRVPKGASVEETGALVDALETRSLTPRAFTRQSDDVAEMTNERGEAAGSVRTLVYARTEDEVAATAKAIRALVESIDLPIVVGIHDPRHLVARDPPPPSQKVAHGAHEVLDNWEYALCGGLRRAVTAIIDPNVRTLEISEREMWKRQTIAGPLKLAHVACFRLGAAGPELVLAAEKRDGERVELARGPAKSEMAETVARMAKKLMIPLDPPSA